MAPHANALIPAQVDLALGPEMTNAAGNQFDSPSDVNAIDSANAVEAADKQDALDETVPAEPADEDPTVNNDSEQ